jgi:tetratricopeptide (TPR) repeat protein
MNNLGNVLRSQGKHEKAEQMHRQALKAYKKVLSKEHPDTFNSMKNLANVLDDQRKYEEAERIRSRLKG